MSPASKLLSSALKPLKQNMPPLKEGHFRLSVDSLGFEIDCAEQTTAWLRACYNDDATFNRKYLSEPTGMVLESLSAEEVQCLKQLCQESSAQTTLRKRHWIDWPLPKTQSRGQGQGQDSGGHAGREIRLTLLPGVYRCSQKMQFKAALELDPFESSLSRFRSAVPINTDRRKSYVSHCRDVVSRLEEAAMGGLDSASANTSLFEMQPGQLSSMSNATVKVVHAWYLLHCVEAEMIEGEAATAGSASH